MYEKYFARPIYSSLDSRRNRNRHRLVRHFLGWLGACRPHRRFAAWLVSVDDWRQVGFWLLIIFIDGYWTLMLILLYFNDYSLVYPLMDAISGGWQ